VGTPSPSVSPSPSVRVDSPASVATPTLISVTKETRNRATFAWRWSGSGNVTFKLYKCTGTGCTPSTLVASGPYAYTSNTNLSYTVDSVLSGLNDTPNCFALTAETSLSESIKSNIECVNK